MAEDESKTLHCVVHGRVQGVGFRYWTAGRAAKIGVCGTVRNLADGTVEAVATGTQKQLEAFVADLHKGPALARVQKVLVSDVDLLSVEDFQIIRGDTLRNPGFFSADGLKTFDCVIDNELHAG